MIKTQLLRYAAIGMATVSMAGFAAASTVSFDTTGADSNQKVELNNDSTVENTNVNFVGVGNLNAQEAVSGDVKANKNTSETGAVGSGDASNGNTTATTVTVTNGGVGNGLAAWFGTTPNDTVDIFKTGADSNQKVEINNNKSVEVTNVNQVQVENVNLQSAQSGNVNANKNTEVGSLKSGDAQNTSHTTTTLTIGN